MITAIKNFILSYYLFKRYNIDVNTLPYFGSKCGYDSFERIGWVGYTTFGNCIYNGHGSFMQYCYESPKDFNGARKFLEEEYGITLFKTKDKALSLEISAAFKTINSFKGDKHTDILDLKRPVTENMKKKWVKLK